MFEGLLEIIEEAKVITIFRHTHADMDALGSQYGLKRWIEENYPEKAVYALGYDRDDGGLFEATDEIADEIIQNSLAIVLDVSGIDRIDDQRFALAKRIIVIDHHPSQDQFMEREYRFEHYAATCEILTQFFLDTQKGISREVATRLYRGLLTDTMSFKTTNTTSHTLQMAAVLCDTGIDIVQCNADVYDISLQQFRFASFVRSAATIEECGLVYCLLTKEDCDRFHLLPAQAKDYVSQFHGIKGVKVWCIFVESQPGIYEGSLRSVRDKVINTIANRHHGGGHPCAAGVSGLDKNELAEILQEFRDLIAG